MSGKYDGAHWGRDSRYRGSPALKEEWLLADQLNANTDGTDGVPRPGGEWVPRRAIWVREDLNPRDAVDPDRVREYAENFAMLPPITVQRDTFALIDGNHRLAASFEDVAGSVCIRIEEVDVDERQMRRLAFLSNARHGLPLTKAERIKHARWLAESYPDMTDAAIAREAGVHRMTVAAWRGRSAARAASETPPIRDQVSESASFSTVQQEETVSPSGRSAPVVVAPVLPDWEAPDTPSEDRLPRFVPPPYEPASEDVSSSQRAKLLQEAVAVLARLGETFTAEEGWAIVRAGWMPDAELVSVARTVLTMCIESWEAEG